LLISPGLYCTVPVKAVMAKIGNIEELRHLCADKGHRELPEIPFQKYHGIPGLLSCVEFAAGIPGNF